ncbi:formylglycine-generating enzyme family protein [Leptothoe kymatousa]|uniref:Formylglycine-generating enzyme family protein n=1 Tax=Leptothoe kymatousa TAU-MAC 1615 TaxID=2364775 RepID=A0ABS5XYX6_9CYAN|nr:formylglycine-generating enzyme family protein [Leptothoe kymatousa]MBT9310824.1 formylglycine-generating enzyme family protein [Leptothoe kymatousa TAU-MAC 1615]
MNTERLVEALNEYALNPTEIADILWLALRQPPIDIAPEPEEKDSSETDDIDPQPLDEGNPPIEEEEDPDDGDDDEQPNNPAADIASIPPGNLPPKALPISVPDAGLLEETLPLVRALRPLLKQIESETASHVDEAATVDHIAETDIWSPILQPDREPWFEVALVIDGSAGMALWQRLIQDIQRLLRCYGSFRDFRVWELVVKDGQSGVCALPDRSVRSPRALLTPNGRRLTLVFSDCTADYWWDGSLQPMLALWGQSMPIAIWQVLPDWMWKRTALGVGEYVAIRNRIPGAANQDLKPTYLALRPPKRLAQQNTAETTSGPPICLPVITTDGASIGAWSRMLAGDRRQSAPGFVLPADGWERGRERPANESDQRLEQFRLRATPEARRLAALLSAAPVITLPVMRLIRASMLSGSSPLPVAEVFLGGLLQRSADQPADTGAELVQYDFPVETRDRLLDILPPVEAVSVIDAVSGYVAEQLNCTLADFRALLLSPELRAEAEAYGLKKFAQVTARILRTLGDQYANLADQLDPRQSVDPSTTKEWPDFELQTFEYAVAEFLDFPPLRTLDYETVQLQLEEEPNFPPLQTKEVEVVTIVLEEPTGTIPVEEIKAFSFDMAIIERRGIFRRPWEVRTQKRQAERYRERLGTDTFIMMVAVPAGSFVMGSPADEPERFDNEGPQHDVQVNGFFMGQYPVTQAQWRFVAGLPQIEHPLEADPSRFKGDNRPVEQVSWYEAVEFCQRLSAYTGHEYGLPTEAEWEYACRANTTTPFSFGEMITTDVANYNGTYVYNDGRKGQYREQTTPVTQVRVANGFGLCDMHGNVWEWCQDHWHGNYNRAPTDGSAWLTENEDVNHVVRGGSWPYDPRNCRSASRGDLTPDARLDTVGFRVVCRAPRALQ